jgi:tetratricopeptide (TPR) repeat protein
MSTPLSALSLAGHEAAVIAGGAAFITLAIGIGANLHSRRRLGTNDKAALSVIFALAAAVAVLIGGELVHFEVVASPFLVAGPLALLLLITAVCYAVHGLAEIRRFRDRWPRGRRRAMAVVVTPVILALVIVAAVVAHSSGYPVFGSLVSGTAGPSIVDQAHNFRFDAPPPWVQAEATRFDPAATVALARQSPPMYATLIIEPLTAGPGSSLETAAENLKTKLGQDSQGQVLNASAQVENGVTGFRIESLVSIGSDRQYQVHWLIQDGRSLYQLRTWGAQEVREAVSNESRKLAAGFRLIDPAPTVLGAPAPVAITFASPRFGYTVDLTKTVWTRPWGSIEKEMPFAEFGALNTRASAAFCIIPVWIGDDELDLDVLSQALSIRVGIPFLRESLFSIRSFRQGPLRGRAFAAEQTQNGVPLLYRLRVLRGRGYAYLLAAWMKKSVESSSEFLDLALDCVTFAETVAPEPPILDDRPRATHAEVWNDIGTALFHSNHAEAALPWFRRAFEVAPANPRSLINYSETCLKLNRPADALAYLDQHLAAFPGSQPVAACRAAVQVQSGDTAGGLKAYHDLFATGWRDDSAFTRYLSTFTAQRRFDDALAALDLYAKGQDSAPLKSLRAQILELRGKK